MWKECWAKKTRVKAPEVGKGQKRKETISMAKRSTKYFKFYFKLLLNMTK